MENALLSTYYTRGTQGSHDEKSELPVATSCCRERARSPEADEGTNRSDPAFDPPLTAPEKRPNTQQEHVHVAIEAVVRLGFASLGAVRLCCQPSLTLQSAPVRAQGCLASGYNIYNLQIQVIPGVHVRRRKLRSSSWPWLWLAWSGAGAGRAACCTETKSTAHQRREAAAARTIGGPALNPETYEVPNHLLLLLLLLVLLLVLLVLLPLLLINCCVPWLHRPGFRTKNGKLLQAASCQLWVRNALCRAALQPARNQYSLVRSRQQYVKGWQMRKWKQAPSQSLGGLQDNMLETCCSTRMHRRKQTPLRYKARPSERPMRWYRPSVTTTSSAASSGNRQEQGAKAGCWKIR